MKELIVATEIHRGQLTRLKKLINEKNFPYKSYCRFYRDVFLFEKFKVVQNQVDVSTEYDYTMQLSIIILQQKLRLEFPKFRHWFRKLCHFYKILNEKSWRLLFNLTPNQNTAHETRNSNNIPAIRVKHDYFKNTFFLSTISERNKLYQKIRNSGSLSVIKSLLNFTRPSANIWNQTSSKILPRLQ